MTKEFEVVSISVNLYSLKHNEIKRFLDKFYDSDILIPDDLKWEKEFLNPIEIVDIIGVFIDNKEEFSINMWLNLDEDFLLNVTDTNSDKIIRYLFERYPY